MLDVGPHGCNAADVVERCVDDILRVGEDQAIDAPTLRFLKDKPGLADMQVATGKRHVVLGDNVQNFLYVVTHSPVIVEHRNDCHRPHLLRRCRMAPV